jgi:hypothetical protein
MFGSSTTGAPRRLAAGIGLALVLGAGCGQEEDNVLPETTLRIDGELSDWHQAVGVRRLTDDPEGDGRDQLSKETFIAPEADLVSVSAAHDADRLYFLLELAGPRPEGKPIEYAIYLDTDNRTDTGYVVGDNAIGAEFVVVNGSLLEHASADRTEWLWTTLDWKVEELETGPQDHALELSIDRRAIEAPGGGRFLSIGLLFSTIEPHDPNMWEDNVTDFSPEQNGRPGRLEYRVFPVQPPRPPVMAPRPAVAGVRTYLLYRGGWDRGIIERVYRYDLVILDAHRGPHPSQIAPVVRRIRAGVNGIPGDTDDVLVLAHMSLGADVRTFDDGFPLEGDGRGPATWDRDSEQLVYQEQGIASYYLDEKTEEDETSVPDGVPDRAGAGGACFVNPGDPAWRSFLIGKDGRAGSPYSAHVLLDLLGYQGLFLDMPEVADPWRGYGYTAQGMYETIASIRETFSGTLLLLPRGGFFFLPQFPLQFQWNPRKLIDIGLYESHYLDSDYGEGEATKPYHLSPTFDSSSVFFDQKIQAELQRTDDSFELMLSLDYAADPDNLPGDHPEVFGEAIASSLQGYGRVPLITTRLVDATPTLTLDHPMPEDVAPPRWGNTTVGFSDLLPDPPPPFMNAGNEDRVPKAPRVGLQKAVPGDGQVTLRWDVALDQTLPVHYNVYYADYFPFDPREAQVLTNVATEMGADYVDRSLTSADDGCPYQFTVKGLENGRTYYFLVRAEDSTPGTPGEEGRGPRGGLQDDNVNVLAAVPRKLDQPDDAGITIDGAFDDWEAVPGRLDREGEAPQLRPDWLEARLAEDVDWFYVFYETTQPIEPTAAHSIFINADASSWTGLRTGGGADFVVRGGQVLRYAGTGVDDQWTVVGPVELGRDGGRVELRIHRETLAATGEGPVFSLLGIPTAGTVDALPDQGSGFFLPTEAPSP